MGYMREGTPYLITQVSILKDHMTFTLSPDGAKEELDVFIEKMKTGEGHFIRKTSTLIKEKTVIIGYSQKAIYVGINPDNDISDETLRVLMKRVAERYTSDHQMQYREEQISSQFDVSETMGDYRVFGKIAFNVLSDIKGKSAYADMLLSPVLLTDCTPAKESGKSCQVFVCATPDGKALYFAREKKGHEGVKGTVTEDYQGILVHDHGITFYNYGANHQECLAHVLRYLKDSMDNEPDRTWNKEMRSLVREMIHFQKSFQPPQNPDSEKVSEYEKRYRKILETAKREYGEVPASDYYRDGYNLFLRMEKYMQNHLLFLHDSRVPATNNEAERLLRNYKRKQAQAVTFRSFESINYLCQCMSMLVLMRLEEPANIFDRVSKIFG